MGFYFLSHFHLLPSTKHQMRMKNILLLLIFCFVQIVAVISAPSQRNEEIRKEVTAIRKKAEAKEGLANSLYLQRDAWNSHYNKSTTCLGSCFTRMMAGCTNCFGDRNMAAANRLEKKADKLDKTKKSVRGRTK